MGAPTELAPPGYLCARPKADQLALRCVTSSQEMRRSTTSQMVSRLTMLKANVTL